ncbi:TonB family protein [Candidatus Regiella endosymbiont of Tuberolachnus salignus]|uniref:TonB family protein n=1 Tax=Candidatus Regiella endosymbiont of Tuberolachnus salignus TaxID=3077956 RepID=UPI0030CE3405
MQRKKVISHHHIIGSAIFSIGLHGSLIVLLLYFFTQNNPVFPITNSAPLAVTMVNNSTFITAPQRTTTRSEKSQHEQAETISSALNNVSKPQHLVKPVQQALKPTLTQPKIKKSETIKTNSSMNESAPNSLISKTGSEQLPTASTTLKTPSLPSEPRALIKTKPIYPARAQALGIEGRVKIQYDIDKNGYVINLRILEATPRNIFEREVKKAVKIWRYEAIAVKDYVTEIVFKIPTP